MLTPALAQRPVPHGEIDAMGENPAYEFKKSGEFTPYTAPFNVSGQPAISVPLYQGEDGLPMAVQLVGTASWARACCCRCAASWRRPGPGPTGSRPSRRGQRPS